MRLEKEGILLWAIEGLISERSEENLQQVMEQRIQPGSDEISGARQGGRCDI